MKRIKELLDKDDLINLINQTHDKLSFVDTEYVYRVVNSAYLTTFNTTANQIIGKKVWDVIGEKPFYEVVKPYIDRALLGEEIVYEAWFDFSTASRAYLIVQYRPVYNDDRIITGVTITTTDITERKRLEEEKMFYEKLMLEHSKMAQLGDMIGMIAHEWRAPLHTLNTYLLRLRTESNPKSEETFDRCESLIEQLSGSIDKLYAFCNDDETLTTIHTSIEQAIALLHHRIRSERIVIHQDIADSCMFSPHNSNLLHIFIILIENAIDALQACDQSEKTIHISGTCDTHQIAIDFRDNGDGVSADIIEKLFRVGTSSKASSGHGYGLYFAKKIIAEYLHGTIDLLDSKEGAHFRITIPIFEN